MVVRVGVDYELNIVRPSRSSVRHVDLLSIAMVVRIGSIEHAEASGRSECHGRVGALKFLSYYLILSKDT